MFSTQELIKLTESFLPYPTPSPKPDIITAIDHTDLSGREVRLYLNSGQRRILGSISLDFDGKPSIRLSAEEWQGLHLHFYLQQPLTS